MTFKSLENFSKIWQVKIDYCLKTTLGLILGKCKIFFPETLTELRDFLLYIKNIIIFLLWALIKFINFKNRKSNFIKLQNLTKYH